VGCIAIEQLRHPSDAHLRHANDVTGLANREHRARQTHRDDLVGADRRVAVSINRAVAASLSLAPLKSRSNRVGMGSVYRSRWLRVRSSSGIRSRSRDRTLIAQHPGGSVYSSRMNSPSLRQKR